MIFSQEQYGGYLFSRISIFFVRVKISFSQDSINLKINLFCSDKKYNFCMIFLHVYNHTYVYNYSYVATFCYFKPQQLLGMQTQCQQSSRPQTNHL